MEKQVISPERVCQRKHHEREDLEIQVEIVWSKTEAKSISHKRNTMHQQLEMQMQRVFTLREHAE